MGEEKLGMELVTRGIWRWIEMGGASWQSKGRVAERRSSEEDVPRNDEIGGIARRDDPRFRRVRGVGG